ncbi:YceI family protein [Nonomuraea spiralis]|uniref:YceI family protein n=1 Tax=Nonomuraea spiralis TaxID=46182 RepID=UPI0037A8B939
MTSTTSLSTLTGDYVIDPTGTRIGFVARHTMASRVRGRFDDFEGALRLDGDDPSRSDVRLAIRSHSIRTGSEQRDGHLRGRFLRVGDHPSITFTSTGAERTGEAAFRLTGDLTMCGVTRPVALDLTLTGDGDRVRFGGGATIDRLDWGVNWNAATALLVAREVVLELDVTATRRP